MAAEAAGKRSKRAVVRRVFGDGGMGPVAHQRFMESGRRREAESEEVEVGGGFGVATGAKATEARNRAEEGARVAAAAAMKRLEAAEAKEAEVQPMTHDQCHLPGPMTTMFLNSGSARLHPLQRIRRPPPRGVPWHAYRQSGRAS